MGKRCNEKVKGERQVSGVPRLTIVEVKTYTPAGLEQMVLNEMAGRLMIKDKDILNYFLFFNIKQQLFSKTRKKESYRHGGPESEG